MTNLSKFTVNLKGNEVSVFKTTNDVNGSPRYLIHFLDLDLNEYESTKATRKAGFKIYRGKAFGGGFVFTSYSVEQELNTMYDILHENK